MNNKCAIILAGGKGSRMKKEQPKVLCEVLFEPMIKLVLLACKNFKTENKCVVVGEHSEQIKNCVKNMAAVFAFQPQPKGTAHAVLCAKNFLEKNINSDVFICCGDSPLMDSKTIDEAFELHKKNNSSATIITTKLKDSTNYGRIIRNKDQKIVRIVEEKDANSSEKQIKEVNSGAYWFNVKNLLQVLTRINNANANKEFYLTDAISLLISDKKNVETFNTKNSEFCLGANNNIQLLELNQVLRKKIIYDFIEQGVEFVNLDGIIISPNVKIMPGTKILPGSIIIKNSIVGKNCIIGPNTIIENSSVGEGCIINSSQIYKSKIESKVKMGPFCHVRPNSNILSQNKIGNFVEIKNSTLGEGTSVAHLTYVGDSDVGKNVNFGCGVVTTNFDGVNKNRCEIQDGAFLGCNTNLIAPVKIGKNAYTGAGSTIDKDVPDESLAIERSKQINIKDFSKTKLAGRKLKVK